MDVTTPYGYGTNSAAAQLIEVTLVSGAVARVMTQQEADWFNESRDRYLEETRFTENTDVQDLDRLLQLELLQFRWNQWLLAGVDYENSLVNENEIAKKLKDQTDSINRLKEQMGLSKKSRDASATSVSDRWDDLKRRAKEFGIHRENQLRAALVLMNELSDIVGSYDRSDPEERKKLGFEDEKEIVSWIRETMIPEYSEIDAYFIANQQKMWAR